MTEASIPRERAKTAKPRAAQPMADPQDVLVYLHRILTQVAAHDFSEKPPLAEGDGPISRLLVGFRFIVDEIEAAHRERQAELERLREMDRMRTRFINMVAHELNTPITPIRLQLHMLRGAAMDASSERSLVVIERSTARLERLVKDMVEVARMESGHFPVERMRIDLAQVLRRAADPHRETIRAAGLAFSMELEIDLLAFADPVRMQQVVTNLLLNAVGATASGGRVALTARRAGGLIRVQVTDSGEGVPVGRIPEVFQPFSQVNDRALGRGEGTGLGLCISKGIVEQHDGRIWCESDGVQRGARFIFTLRDATDQGLRRVVADVTASRSIAVASVSGRPRCPFSKPWRSPRRSA